MYMFLFKRLYSGIYMNWPNQRKKEKSDKFLLQMCVMKKSSLLWPILQIPLRATDQDGPYV